MTWRRPTSEIADLKQLGADIVLVDGPDLTREVKAAEKATRQVPSTDLAGQIAKDTLFAPVDRHFTLKEIAEAAKYSWADARKGKVMLAPNAV